MRYTVFGNFTQQVFRLNILVVLSEDKFQLFRVISPTETGISEVFPARLSFRIVFPAEKIHARRQLNNI